MQQLALFRSSPLELTLLGGPAGERGDQETTAGPPRPVSKEAVDLARRLPWVSPRCSPPSRQRGWCFVGPDIRHARWR
jgi:hypothetical protein